MRSGLPLLRTSSGEHTVVETPVPIPNTVVKHPGPMIVRALAKVGIARFMAPLGRNSKRGFLFWGRDESNENLPVTVQGGIRALKDIQALEILEQYDERNSGTHHGRSLV